MPNGASGGRHFVLIIAACGNEVFGSLVKGQRQVCEMVASIILPW